MLSFEATYMCEGGHGHLSDTKGCDSHIPLVFDCESSSPSFHGLVRYLEGVTLAFSVFVCVFYFVLGKY